MMLKNCRCKSIKQSLCKYGRENVKYINLHFVYFLGVSIMSLLPV